VHLRDNRPPTAMQTPLVQSISAPSQLYLEPEFISPTASLSQLNALTALPHTMASAMARGRGNRKGRKPGRLVREDQIVSVLFDTFGRRPQPTNGLSLEQSVRVELQISQVNYLTSLTTQGASAYSTAAFTISQFLGATSLLSVFDQYRIEQLECWVEANAPNSTASLPELTSCVDLDDANVPTSLGSIQDHMGAIVSCLPSGHYHKWKPHIAIAAYSGTFTSYSNAASQWIDSASPNVQHFGLKLALTSSSTTAMSVNLVTRAVVTFRAPTIA
jgi:hypothetical protein